MFTVQTECKWVCRPFAIAWSSRMQLTDQVNAITQVAWRLLPTTRSSIQPTVLVFEMQKLRSKRLECSCLAAPSLTAESDLISRFTVMAQSGSSQEAPCLHPSRMGVCRLLHKLQGRNSEDKQRLLSEPWIMLPDDPDSESWRGYIAECIRVAGGSIKGSVDDFSQEIYRSTFGIKRLGACPRTEQFQLIIAPALKEASEHRYAVTPVQGQPD